MIEPGQILPTTKLGAMLTALAKEAEVIVETGTWTGLGSTLCLREGLVRSTQQLWTVETNADRHAYAKQIHGDDPRIHCLLGTIVTGDEIKFPYNPPFSPEHQSEIDQNNTAPLVFTQLPETIDLLFVDGGAFSGFAEVCKLYGRSKVIAMDDVFDTKNGMSYGLLAYCKGWDLVDCQKDRNGWAVFRRKP